MGHRLVRACVFCLLCAAHAHCSMHPNYDLNNTHSKLSSAGGGSTTDKRGPKHEAEIKNSWLDNQPFVKMVFQKFGDGETISIEGFEKLLRAMHLEGLIQARPHPVFNISERAESGNSTVLKPVYNPQEFIKHECISSESLMGGALVLTPTTYKDVCPVLLSQFLPLDLHSPHNSLCSTHSHNSIHRASMHDQIKVWLYSTLSIIIISLCGLLGVTVIPIMQKVFYHHIIQFLVALAVGTLCGDALLHLLPHAMMPSEHSHGHDNNLDSLDVEDHDVNVYRGLVAMLGVIFFYFTEKCLTLIAEWRKNRQMKNQVRRKVRVVRDTEGSSSNNTSEKLCKHKYSSYPYCYGEIADNPENHMKHNHHDFTDDSPNSVLTTKDGIATETLRPFNKRYSSDHINRPDLTKENELMGADKKLLDTSADINIPDERYTVIIREHENTHHGHSHTHGHVHSAPQSLSSVALMVVLGDGLHNFTDGMAIGAAFSSNIAGGFSTALAVFCHELPHELGDFAVLLQAGMSAKQAVFYNLLSSILCFIGMCFGIFLGHNETTTQWVFAAAGGMFLYIALVDMIPELTNSHSYGGAFLQCVLQLAGLMTGTGIMFLIAIYEHDLMNIFGD